MLCNGFKAQSKFLFSLMREIMMTPHRTMFWQINPVWIFYVLAVLAMALFLAGLAAHIMVWKKSGGTRDVGYSGDALKKMLLDVFLGRRLFKGHAAAGLMHLLIFWGFVILFIGTSVLAIHHYVTCFLEGMSHLAFSFCMELAGLMLLIGIIWALVRRYFQRVPRLERRLEDALVPLWLLLMVLSGFILEGLRLSARQPTWAAWSFVGAGLGGFFSPESAKAFLPCLLVDPCTALFKLHCANPLYQTLSYSWGSGGHLFQERRGTSPPEHGGRCRGFESG